MVSGEFVKFLLGEHASGRRDNSHWLWSLLMLELWFRDFEEPAAPQPSDRLLDIQGSVPARQ